MASLSTILTSLNRGFLKNLLTGAGLTFATSGVVLTALNTAVDTFRNSLGSISGTLIGLMGLSGLHIYFSLVLGAISARYVQNSAKLYLTRK